MGSEHAYSMKLVIFNEPYVNKCSYVQHRMLIDYNACQVSNIKKRLYIENQVMVKSVIKLLKMTSPKGKYYD